MFSCGNKCLPKVFSRISAPDELDQYSQIQSPLLHSSATAILRLQVFHDRGKIYSQAHPFLKSTIVHVRLLYCKIPNFILQKTKEIHWESSTLERVNSSSDIIEDPVRCSLRQREIKWSTGNSILKSEQLKDKIYYHTFWILRNFLALIKTIMYHTIGIIRVF